VLLHLTWRLPRVAATVSTPRRELEDTLTALGVTADCRDDLMLALSEACANAVEHAGLGAEYQVTVTADRHGCVAEIADCGVGLAPVVPDRPGATALPVRGRGMAIIRACTDWLELDPVEPHGLAVRFGKRLTWEAGGT
jgi:serine/threonine-protein kinase RsbW